MFAPYRPEVELAHSAQAVVFKGHAPDGRPVALKLLLDPSSERRARFARERALLQELDDVEGFVPLLDVVDTPRGPCLVMPFMPGGTLRDRLRTSGPLRVHEAVRLVRRLGAALGRVHARGVVHRDLKPENVLFDARGKPLLADLGVARTSTCTNDLTRTGELWGTPGYMPPEQISDARAVGPSADVFALGALLYECLTGAPPFAGRDSIDVLARTASGRFDPLGPSRPDAPRWLVDVVGRCLAPDPARRYPDGAAVAAALARGPLARERRSRRALPVGAAVAVGAGAAAALLTSGAPTGAPPAPTPPVTDVVRPPSTSTDAPPPPGSAGPAALEPAPAAPVLDGPEEPRPVDAAAVEAPPAERLGGPPPAGLAEAMSLLTPQLERAAARGGDRPWRISRRPDAYVFENDTDRLASHHQYVEVEDDGRLYRVVAEVVVEGAPGAELAGAGIVCDLDPERRTYWAVVAAPDGSVRVFYHAPTVFIPRGSFGAGSTLAPGARRRLEVTCLADGISVRADGQPLVTLRGTTRTPRCRAGIIVMSRGRFTFSRFSVAVAVGDR